MEIKMLKQVIDKSKDHLDHAGESYAAHFLFALKMGGLCFVAGFGIMIHALCPAIFPTIGSRTIFKMHDIMIARKEKQNAQNTNHP
jgi:Family of unknown function (DUF6356)